MAPPAWSSIFGLLAQLVEHFPVSDVVTGSIPVQAAISFSAIAQSGRALDRKSKRRWFDPSSRNHTFILVRPDGEIGRRIGLKTRGRKAVPVRDRIGIPTHMLMWRNWQTRLLQKQVPWEFDPPREHQISLLPRWWNWETHWLQMPALSGMPVRRRPGAPSFFGSLAEWSIAAALKADRSGDPRRRGSNPLASAIIDSGDVPERPIGTRWKRDRCITCGTGVRNPASPPDHS